MKILIAFIFAATHSIATVAASDPYNTSTAKPAEELWLNPGFYSYHFEPERQLNNNNLGLGLEYRYSSENSITAGRFNNSDRQISNYAGWCWQPFTIGPVRLGGLIGIINGYLKANSGDWIPLLLPVASYEYKRIGINLTVIPTYNDVIYGALTMQLKFKIH